jgi:CheY-like chemotaxis protein
MLLHKDFKNDSEVVPVLLPGKDPYLIIPSPSESKTGSDPFGWREMQVLIVDDNNADARMVRALLEATGMPTNITLVGDGEGAIRIMESASMGQRPAPDLVILDINLPRKNGHDVLTSIRAMDRLAHTCVAMCSSSNSNDDKRQARENGANAYLLKPMGLEEMEEMIVTLRHIFVTLNEEAVVAKFF